LFRDTFFLSNTELVDRGKFTLKTAFFCSAASRRNGHGLSSGTPSVSLDQCVPAATSGALPSVGFPRTAKAVQIIYRGAEMKKLFVIGHGWMRSSRFVLASLFGLFLAAPAFAQANSPWENAVNVLQQAFTSTIARGLSLVAIVVSGLTFAFGEGGSKRVLAGVLFGVGMAIAAVNFLAWLFPA
jgi:type IV secretory pathway VirB2 component (pilin)